ncbi:hypothetical protein CPB84DRAFT_1727525 [Gymnopilus junonius]|uniref:Uncharacterized protein n=1 Tax=Gymnopilus junonius TaxID=109634 RepID=A0A9P5TGS4_GYMJU|nr:hypothetical protein CPB84DRAFT_1854124 [Gymnopilus junonius]KAF8904672.1 hypothetical protein CPB84DRAFT_1727525 [Gymnopilus junonius]
MRPGFLSNIFASSTTAFIVLAFFSLRASANYFVVTNPAASAQWPNNAANLVTWQKGVLDGVDMFDLEMARMSQDGLILVARNVPAAQGKLNIQLQDIPPADDYFLIFINSTHGVLHTTSSRFTILAPSASPSGSVPSPAGSVPTVTVSGSPNPTILFATTFPPVVSAAQMLLPPVHLSQLLLTFVGVFFGVAWTLALGS